VKWETGRRARYLGLSTEGTGALRRMVSKEEAKLGKENRPDGGEECDGIPKGLKKKEKGGAFAKKPKENKTSLVNTTCEAPLQ